MNAKQWLSAHGYDDVLKKIDQVEARIDKRQTKTRRSWFEPLAGHKNGSPSKVLGVTFPIINAFRIRRGWAPVPNGISRSDNELVPPPKSQARWTRNS